MYPQAEPQEAIRSIAGAALRDTPHSPLILALSETRQRLEIALAGLQSLEQQLDPLLRPADPQPAKATREGTPSVANGDRVTGELADLIRGLELVTQRIDMMRGRLVV